MTDCVPIVFCSCHSSVIGQYECETHKKSRIIFTAQDIIKLIDRIEALEKKLEGK